MHRVLFILVSLFSIWAPSARAADVVTCTHGDAHRTVRVDSRVPDGAPCEVRYTKEPEARDDVLWSAARDRAYCDEKAADLVARLRAARWHCTEHQELAEPVPARVSIGAGPPEESHAQRETRDAHVGAAFSLPRIEAAPEESERVFVPLSRDQIAMDPKLRFFRHAFGATALRDALRIIRVDLNRDGVEELFLQVDLRDACGAAPCTWDLFQQSPDGHLESLGVRGALAWHALAGDSGGFPNLSVRLQENAGNTYATYRFEMGMYRMLEGSRSAERPDLEVVDVNAEGS